MKKLHIARLILILILGLSGYGLLLWFNWKIALGVFLVHWFINMERNLK